jgi:hypothetical protein
LAYVIPPSGGYGERGRRRSHGDIAPEDTLDRQMPEGELARRYMAVPIDAAVDALAREYLRGGGGQLAKRSRIGLGDQVEPPLDGGDGDGDPA